MRLTFFMLLLPLQLLAQDYAGEYTTCCGWDGKEYTMILYPENACEISTTINLTINDTSELRNHPKILKDNPSVNSYINPPALPDGIKIDGIYQADPLEFPFTFYGLKKIHHYTWENQDNQIVLYDKNKQSSIVFKPWQFGLFAQSSLNTEFNFVTEKDSVRFFQQTSYYDRGAQKSLISEDYVDDNGVPSSYEKVTFYEMGNTSIDIFVVGMEHPILSESKYENEEDEHFYTITLANEKILKDYQNQELFYLTNFNTKHRGYYHYSTKHHFEMEYYHLSELAPVWMGERFLLKSEGWWKMGVKHGKWMEYDNSGRLTSLKVYKDGKLKKEKKY
jgi:hypothetical protein